MKILTKPRRSRERIAIYGAPKSGKTRLATSLPWGEYWGEQAIYCGIDPSSCELRPVLIENRKRLHPIEFEGKPNPLEEFVAAATKDWKAEFPKAGTLIWDTMTVTGQVLLQYYANSGAFSDRHAVQLGKQGTKSWHTAPMQGDYGAAQNSTGFLLGHLWDQPLHVIVLFHEKWVEPKEGSPEGLAGGPDVVGSKAVRWIGGQFDSVFRTDMAMDPKTRTAGFAVQTVTRGIWKAGFRTSQPMQLLDPVVHLDADPSGFWKRYLEDVGGGE